MSWTHFLLSPLTIRVQNLLSELNTDTCPTHFLHHKFWNKKKYQERHFAGCTVTVTYYERMAHIHTVTFSGPESNISLLVVHVLFFMYRVLILFARPCNISLEVGVVGWLWGLSTKDFWQLWWRSASACRSRKKVECEGRVMICICSVNTLQAEQCLNDRWT